MVGPAEWLERCRLVVCVGSGGVGKTTLAATTGLWAAMQGRRVMVLTIDPARRLANSLGLDSIGNEPRDIALPEGAGSLSAMMLDPRHTLDHLVTQLAPDEATAQRILANHVYRHLSNTLAGNQDYMATEALYDLVNSGQYDLIVLDTPPVKNALDFLESPGRLMNFLDERVLKWFLAPYEEHRRGGVLGGMMLGTTAIVFRLLAHVFGQEFLDDLAQFFQDFKHMLAGFSQRHGAVLELLEASDTSFLTVCAPTPPSLDVARFFQEELGGRGLHRGGVVVNQVHQCHHDAHDTEVLEPHLASLDPVLARRVLARLGMAHRRLRKQAEADAVRVAGVRDLAREGFFVTLPRQQHEVHDLDGLLALGRALYATPR